MSWTHGNLVSKLRRSRGKTLPRVWMGGLCVCSQANTGSLFRNRLITSDSNLFLFRKYTNRLQVLFASVFKKPSWQAFWVYIKWVVMNQRFCVRVCSDTGGWRGEWVWVALSSRWRRCLRQGAVWQSGAFHICMQNDRSSSNGVGGLVCER